MRADEERDSLDLSMEISNRSAIGDEEDLYADVEADDLSAVSVDELLAGGDDDEDERQGAPLVPLEELGIVGFLARNSDQGPRLDQLETWSDEFVRDVTQMFGETEIFHQRTERNPQTNAITIHHYSNTFHVEWNTSEGIRRGATSEPVRERVFMHGLWVYGTFYERYSRDPVQNGSQPSQPGYTGNRSRDRPRPTSMLSSQGGNRYNTRNQRVFAVDHNQPDDGSITDPPPPGASRNINSRVTHTLLTLLAIERSRLDETARQRERGDQVIPIMGINMPWIDPIPSAPTKERTNCIFCMDPIDRVDRQTENSIIIRTENMDEMFVGQMHPCGHVYHYDCAHRFIATYAFPAPVPCPLCRAPISRLRAHPTYPDYPFRHVRNIFRVTEDTDTFRNHPEARMPNLGEEEVPETITINTTVDEETEEAGQQEELEKTTQRVEEGSGPRAPQRPITPTTPPPRTPERTNFDRETVTNIVNQIEDNQQQNHPCLPLCTELVCLPSCNRFWEKIKRNETHTLAGTLGTLGTTEDELQLMYASQFARDRAGDRPCTDFCFESVCLTSCPNHEHRRELVRRLHERSALGLAGLTLPRVIKQTAIASTVQRSLTARDERLGRIRPGTREVFSFTRNTEAVLPEDRYQANRAAADLADALQSRDAETPDWDTVQSAMAELRRDLSVTLEPRQQEQQGEAGEAQPQLLQADAVGEEEGNQPGSGEGGENLEES